MPLDVFLALVGFSFVSSVTPGPNNIMLLTSGVNFGFRKTIPHMFGIAIGFGVLLLAVGFGLREIFLQFPVMRTVLKVLGGAYLVYLAWKIANAGPVEAGEEGSKPMSFMAAALFQWVNPKAWVMGVTAMTVYTGEPDFFSSVIIVTLVFMVVNFPSVSVWCGFGVALREWLAEPVRLRIFNVSMALLLVASLWPMLS
ncbi:MAG: LysE family translocator [Rhizobiaceae bacterium]|jgi:threonine/homoserine/homoserine lactone efflux protein|nr:LysE family translocator [Rhizobiaceae bacterium]